MNGDPEETRTPVTAVKGRCLRPLDHGATLVGVRGFEPPAPCSQSTCATGLRYTPKHSAHLSATSLSYTNRAKMSTTFLKLFSGPKNTSGDGSSNLSSKGAENGICYPFRGLFYIFTYYTFLLFLFLFDFKLFYFFS